jgi:hypothetical protein
LSTVRKLDRSLAGIVAKMTRRRAADALDRRRRIA